MASLAQLAALSGGGENGVNNGWRSHPGSGASPASAGGYRHPQRNIFSLIRLRS